MIDGYLIVELGALALLLTGASVVAGTVWYLIYGRTRATHAGAIYHVFERWGKLVDRGIDRELSQAMQSHGLRAQDEYPGLIARAAVLSVPEGEDINVAAQRASAVLGARMGIDTAAVTERFLATESLWIQPSDTHPTATPVAFFDTDDDHLVIVKAGRALEYQPLGVAAANGSTPCSFCRLLGRTRESATTGRRVGGIPAC